MTGTFGVHVEDYIAMRRGLGYQLTGQARYLRNFAGYLDGLRHHGPVPLGLSVDWATSTSSTDPCTRARRLSVLADFLRHLAALDAPPRFHRQDCSAPPAAASPLTCTPKARSRPCCRPQQP